MSEELKREKENEMIEKLKPANQHPDFGKVCIHGHLKRSCYICELEEEIYSLKRTLIDTQKLCAKLSTQNGKMRTALEIISSFCGRPVEYQETPSNKGEVSRLLRDILREAKNSIGDERMSEEQKIRLEPIARMVPNLCLGILGFKEVQGLYDSLNRILNSEFMNRYEIIQDYKPS